MSYNIILYIGNCKLCDAYTEKTVRVGGAREKVMYCWLAVDFENLNTCFPIFKYYKSIYA